MKKLYCLLVSVMFLCTLAFGQTHSVSGQIKDEKGDPVPFASVVEAGTKNGATADVNGFFTIKIKQGSKLTITAQGYKSATIAPTSGTQTISLTTDITTEKEVIVTTAFGIKKAARTTPFSSQVISSENLNIVPSGNLNSALAGKVAGVQYQGQSSMKLNSEGFLRIRGGLSLGDVGAIYVVDGTITNSFDINPNDIESLNILKGANATALFGQQAKNGAIVITTRKKGEKGTAGIELSQGVTVDKAYLFPKYQNRYGGGANKDFQQFHWQSYMPAEWQSLDGKYFPDYTDDSSWGPALGGQEYIPWYAWYPGTKYTGKSAMWVPQPDNAKDFWDKGITTNTNVSFSKSGQGYSTRVSYTNSAIKSMLPGSSSMKNTLFTTVSFDLNDHFSTGADITFVSAKINSKSADASLDAYSNQSSGSFNSWFHRDLDMEKLKELRNLRSPVGTLASWNLHSNPDGYNANNPGQFYEANYWYNYYSYFDNIDYTNYNNRLYGDAYLKYSLNKHFSVKATVRKNQINVTNVNTTRSILQASGIQTGTFAGYGTGLSRANVMDYELIANYSQSFLGKLDVNALIGGNYNDYKFEQVTMATTNGLNVPDLYAITNSKDAIGYSNTRAVSQVHSVFASGDFEWNKFASVTWAVRNDWYSTLRNAANRLLSPQVGVGFIFSQFTKNSLPWLNYGKIYGSWGKKPTSLSTGGPLNNGIYGNNFAYTVNANQWNGNILMATPNQLVDPNLVGSKVTSYEFGFDLRFAKNRVGINANYYIEDNNGEPLAVGVSGVSGFTSKVINAAEIKRQGFELAINARPISNSKGISWDITKTFGYLIKNPVTKLSEGQTQVLYARATPFSGFTSPGTFFELGSDWGQLIGMGIKRNADNVPLINTNGTYVSDATKHWGSVVPKVTGGLINSFSYKDFSLNFSIDYQVGGKFFSLSEMWGNYSGLFAPTAAINDKGMNVRDDVANGGGVHVKGVAASDGKTPVDMYVNAQTYFHSFFGNNVVDPYIHSLTYVKLRQIAFSYNIPMQKFRIGKVIKGATVSVISGNTLLIYRETKSFDPSEISGVFGENGQLPGSRSIGANLKLKF